MTRTRHLAAVAITLLWWSPTLAVMAIRIAPHAVAKLGRPYRTRRARRLIARGRVAEAERVIAAPWRDRAAMERLQRGKKLVIL